MVGCSAASFNPTFTQKHYHGLNVRLITFEVSVSGKHVVVTKPSQCVCFFYIYTKSQRIRSRLTSQCHLTPTLRSHTCVTLSARADLFSINIRADCK